MGQGVIDPPFCYNLSPILISICGKSCPPPHYSQNLSFIAIYFLDNVNPPPYYNQGPAILFLITPTAMIAASVNCNSCDKGFDVTRAAVGRHLQTDCNCHLVSSMVRLDLNQVGNHQTNGFDLPSVSPVACPDPTPVGTHLNQLRETSSLNPGRQSSDENPVCSAQLGVADNQTSN